MVASVFSHPMVHLFIAMQARVPCLVVGMPGCAKTAIHRALARAMGRRFVAMCGSQCSPEDVGGLPVPDYVKHLCRMMPMWWVEALLEAGGFLFLDEFTSLSPAVQAALLTLIQDKLVGDTHLSVDTLIAAACNPEEITPNGTPLSLPTLNRFYHARWVNDRDAWLDGLVTLEWTAPAFPIVPEGWESRIPYWGGLMRTFHQRFEGLENVPPKDDLARAYPSERTWANAVRCLAAADAAGADMHTDNTFVRLMTAGNVGEVVAEQFCHFKSSYDLVDPLDLLDGKITFTHRDSRPDLTLTLAAAVASTVCSRSTFTPDRWDSAVQFLGDISKVAAPEIALKFTGMVQKAAADNGYTPKAVALKPLIELGKLQIG